MDWEGGRGRYIRVRRAVIDAFPLAQARSSLVDGTIMYVVHDGEGGAIGDAATKSLGAWLSALDRLQAATPEDAR